MKELDFRDFNRLVNKKELKKVVLLMGGESFLINWALESISNKYIKEEYKAFDLSKVDGDSVSVDEIIMNADTYSMFSGGRVVIIRNYLPLFNNNVKGFDENEEKKLLNFICNFSGDTIIVFYLDGDKQQQLSSFGNRLKKETQCFSFDKLDLKELKSFIKKRLEKNSLTYGENEIDYIINVSGYMNKEGDYKLSDLNSDLEKLVLLADDKEVCERLINLAILGNEDTYIFSLIDAITMRDIKKAINITIRKSKNNENVFQILGLIISQFELLYDIKSMEEDDMMPYQMEKELKINKCRFDKAYKATRNFSIEELKRILISSYNIDKSIKEGSLREDLALPVFISGLQ
jgi:DNA polymerase-3 subunit delta